MSRNKWYEKSGPEGDIIVSTRVRLARNLKDYPFPSRMTADQINCVNKAVWDAVPDKENYDFVELSSLSSAERLALCQQHLISPEFAEKNDGRAVIMNKDRSICIMLCEEDHVRIQVLCAGFDLKEAYGAAEKIESALEKKLHFAFDKDLGYLTECPTNLGTGMRASVMIHLPALEAANGIEALSRGARKAYFIENAPKALACIEDNLAFTKMKDRAIVLKQDACAGLTGIYEKHVDVIFMDPPYDQEQERRVLEQLRYAKYVSEETLILVEASLHTDFSYVEELGFEVTREKKYKTNKHVFLRRK